jgi:hypothetical protein
MRETLWRPLAWASRCEDCGGCGGTWRNTLAGPTHSATSPPLMCAGFARRLAAWVCCFLVEVHVRATFHAIMPNLSLRPLASPASSRQVTFKWVRPVTADRRCRLLEAREEVAAEDVAPPSYFISHACACERGAGKWEGATTYWTLCVSGLFTVLRLTVNSNAHLRHPLPPSLSREKQPGSAA